MTVQRNTNDLELRPIRGLAADTPPIPVSALGYGAMELRGEGHNGGRAISADEALTVLNRVLDLGITFIDTSPDYGASEELVGSLSRARRAEFVLATKCGCPWYDDPVAPRPLVHDFSRKAMEEVFDRSLSRLQTDYVDVVQVHAGPSRQRLGDDGVIETLTAWRQAGKVRMIGISSESPHLDEHLDMGVFDLVQIPYSVVQRGHEPLVRAAGERGIATVIRGALAKGVPADGQELTGPWAAWGAAGLDELRESGESRASFMLRFVLSHPGVTTAIVGSLNPAHVESNVEAALRGPLPVEVHQEALARLDRPDTARTVGS